MNTTPSVTPSDPALAAAHVAAPFAAPVTTSTAAPAARRASPPGTAAIDWSSYAEVYDMLLAYNPAYQDLVARFEATIRGWTLPAGGSIIDVGAGTGNFSLGWARAFPDSRVLHIDLDPAMNAEAERKARAAGIANLHVRTCSIEDTDCAPGGADAVSAVHALYTFPRPQATLARLFDWLAPGGRAFFCDPGRPLDMRDWTRFFAGHLLQTLGPVRTAQVFWRGREIMRQNRAIRRAQIDGRYWTHSPAAFRAAVEAAGFEVEHAETCFRGYSDLIVARRPLDGNGTRVTEVRA